MINAIYWINMETWWLKLIKDRPEGISNLKFLWIYMATNSLDQDFQSSSCLPQRGNWAGMLIRGWTGVFVVALFFLCRDFVDDDWSFVSVGFSFQSCLTSLLIDIDFFPFFNRLDTSQAIVYEAYPLKYSWFHKSTHNLWLEWQNQIYRRI